MYLQITTHCNMSCPHCIFSCHVGDRNAVHMDKETYKKALKLCDGHITLGGGEPTMHPRFWEFFGMAMSQPYLESLWMATNGSINNIAIALAKISNPNGVFNCALSIDSFHDPIDGEVYQAFQNQGAEIRNVEEGVINKGAAFDNGVGVRDGCGCEDIQIKPDGSVYLCGCPDSIQLGHVDNFLETQERIYDMQNRGIYCVMEFGEEDEIPDEGADREVA